MPGFTASVLHLPDDDLTAIVLLNSDGRVEASHLARRALRLLLTGEADLAAYAPSAEELGNLVGSYRSRRDAAWGVIDDGGRLVLDLAGRRVELTALSATRFCAADSDGTWCFDFEIGENGRASSVEASLTCEPQNRAYRVD